MNSVKLDWRGGGFIRVDYILCIFCENDTIYRLFCGTAIIMDKDSFMSGVS